LRQVAALVLQYRDQRLLPFEPALCHTRGQHSILLPPICEDHDGTLVVLDGTHRLFQLHAVEHERDAHVLVLKGKHPPLPGQPVPFGSVKGFPSKLPRSATFVNYDASNWRGFKPMEKFLSSSVALQFLRK
jgi:hypothetical protein